MRDIKIIAEVGCNHMGSTKVAEEMILIASAFCKVDYVKFQKRNPAELLSTEQYNAPHPNECHSYGKTYGEHREFLEFNIQQHNVLKEECGKHDVNYCTSVWDLPSAKEITSLNPDIIKIPSACNLNFEMLGYLCDNYKGDIHLSFGMTTRKEEDKIVSFFEEKSRAQDLVIYSCTSGYPVAHDEICLKEITRIISTFGSKISDIGFSGHHLGIAADVAAMTLGANWIERHFTLDRTYKGTDHSASLEPDGMRRLCRDIKHVNLALTEKQSDILDVEKAQRIKLKSN